MCVMPLSYGNLPAQRNKMENLADTSQSGCWEMQAAGKGVVLMPFKNCTVPLMGTSSPHSLQTDSKCISFIYAMFLESCQIISGEI